MVPKTRLILRGIFIITISYDFHYTPVVTGLMLLANFLLIAWDWGTFKVIFNHQPNFSTKKQFENDTIWQIKTVAR